MASPKSVSLTSPVYDSITLAGDTSRWINFRSSNACAYTRARAISLTM